MTRRVARRFAPVVFGAAFGWCLAWRSARRLPRRRRPRPRSRAGGGDAPACSVPPEIIEAVPNLPHLAAAIRRKKPVRIVVIGGGSTKGAAAGAPENAYPHRLQVALQKRFPDVPITVVNQGMPRQTARQMVRAVPDRGVRRRADPGHLGGRHQRRGARDRYSTSSRRPCRPASTSSKNRAIDIMLVDMQFSRRASTVIDFDHYLDTIHRVGELNDVYVFPRFAMMRYWSEQNVFNFDDVRGERARPAGRPGL